MKLLLLVRDVGQGESQHQTEAASQWREGRIIFVKWKYGCRKNVILIFSTFSTMRRSAAPSVRAAKKMKFCTPFLAGSKENTTGNSTSATTISLAKQSNPNQVR